MIEVRQAREFSSWLRRLKDDNAATRIVGRIRRIQVTSEASAWA
jgi:putative component of toxin-antitoxin plasmid stabilization module